MWFFQICQIFIFPEMVSFVSFGNFISFLLAKKLEGQREKYSNSPIFFRFKAIISPVSLRCVLSFVILDRGKSESNLLKNTVEYNIVDISSGGF